MTVDNDPRVPALAGAVERVTRRLGGLDTQVRQLAQDVARLAAGAPPGVVPDWLIDPAGLDVPGLLGWIDQVYLAYDGSDLPPCWAWHSGVVSELAWLWLAHQQVRASGDPCRVGDWHDRYRPGVVRRITEATKRCGDVSEHVPGGQGDQARTVPLSGALAAMQAARTAGHPIPAPTDDQITQARALSSRTRATT